MEVSREGSERCTILFGVPCLIQRGIEGMYGRDQAKKKKKVVKYVCELILQTNEANLIKL